MSEEPEQAEDGPEGVELPDDAVEDLDLDEADDAGDVSGGTYNWWKK